MEFGRLSDVDRVRWDMPPEPAWNGRRLEHLKAQSGGAAQSGRADLRIGMASWADEGLSARLGSSRAADALRIHATAVPANELNSTFYGYTPERFQRWRSAVPRDFRFCPKLPRVITHDGGLVDTDEAMEAFVTATGELGEQRGLTWFALPPYVDVRAFGTLQRFLETWAPRLPLAVEVRHGSWFERPAFEDLVVMLADLGVTFILTDTAGRRDVLHMHLTTGETLVRFVANALHHSDFARLDAWAERLVEWSRAGLQRGYFFLHQKNEAETVDLAEHLESRLAALGAPVLEPWRIQTGYRPQGAQLDLF